MVKRDTKINHLITFARVQFKSLKHFVIALQSQGFCAIRVRKLRSVFETIWYLEGVQIRKRFRSNGGVVLYVENFNVESKMGYYVDKIELGYLR